MKKHGEIEDIIKNLILVSISIKLPIFFNLKKSFEKINPVYSEYLSNNSQEFLIDLINYIINQLKKHLDERDEDDIKNFEDKGFISSKKESYDKYIYKIKNT